MRDRYHGELGAVHDQLVGLAALVTKAMVRATTAVVSGDLDAADEVISQDAVIDAARDALDARVMSVLACQQPVATDLRTLVAALRISADLERMGDLARHIAEIARMRYPGAPLPPVLRPDIEEMGRVAQRMATKMRQVLETKDPKAAAELHFDDDAMDDVHRSTFQHMTDEAWLHGMATAVDLTLLSRYYERFADHAVNVANRVIFLATGANARM
ncbi:phosphate signaling complex protein PhoU [Actinacidiphila oryziradicis]|uniref:Phosphate-specific transport system accessory protein PhoU n=1 Tax=Actinacidiphila oryziradicis TaxID=2571141 RepID=A0A4U0RM22_9ACTN|nr:phosphate signaling complex protein PhoU [Actinacidiphila oryziradicis]TJZ96286.1 phosphate signaling complex protein PhoU [Actinacidiphila oryziradicis]